MLFNQRLYPLIVFFSSWHVLSVYVLLFLPIGFSKYSLKLNENCTVVCVFLQWQAISLTVIEKVQIAAAILGSLFLMASISWLVWSSFSPSARWQRQDLLFQICYGMYGFMDIVCIGEVLDFTLVTCIILV